MVKGTEDELFWPYESRLVPKRYVVYISPCRSAEELTLRKIEETVERVLHPLLHKLHLPLYHNNPEFHASFAWCHLDLSAEQSEVGSEEDVAEGWQELDSRTPLEPDSGTGSFSPRTPFTAKILDELSTEFQARIMASQPAGGWQVNHLDLKVAKQVHRLEF